MGRITERLPLDGALIDIVAYCPNCIDRAGADLGQLHYLAFLLVPETVKEREAGFRIELFDLGGGSELTQIFQRFSEAVSTDPALRSVELDPKKWGQSVYQRIMQPLASKLGGRHKLFMVPDGLFHQLPFGALHDEHGYLGERFEFVYLNSGRELLHDVEDRSKPFSVTVLADPEFTGDSRPAGGCGGGPPTSRGHQDAPTWQTRHFALRGNKQPESLPGTCQEAKFIQAIWPGARILLGPAATERALRETVSPDVLHISTHAAFLGAPSASAYTAARHEDMELALAAQDPLLQSMLLLSHVEHKHRASADTEQDPDDRDDGLMTALEVASMHLRGTQLVVLPDCDTALGQIARGEGVYGLRSAVLMAGAETLIASLWKVNDETAPQIIAALYANLLQGKTRIEALHLAHQAIRRTHADPYYWASLVLVGQSGRLRGLASPPQRIPSLPPPCRSRATPLRWLGLVMLLCSALAMGLMVRRRIRIQGQ